MTNEKYLSAKELSAAIEAEHGIAVSVGFVRAMIRSGVPRLGHHARLSDLMLWWSSNPNFVARPNQRKQPRVAA